MIEAQCVTRDASRRDRDGRPESTENVEEQKLKLLTAKL
jgi:hypothetical protein